MDERDIKLLVGKRVRAGRKLRNMTQTELGNHEELMRIENGKYKALYEMQFHRERVGVNG